MASRNGEEIGQVYTKQICDEYEYKYALSKSYISYRDEAKKLAYARDNVAIMISWLDSIIKNIAQSPVQSVKRDCHTPFTEVFNALKDAGKACNGVKDNDKPNDQASVYKRGSFGIL